MWDFFVCHQVAFGNTLMESINRHGRVCLLVRTTYVYTLASRRHNIFQGHAKSNNRFRRESRETNVRYVKEAGGTKSINSIEIICKIIKFQPSEAKHSLSLSSVSSGQSEEDENHGAS